ncbi:hypothetical protein [Algoriphagus sp. CAU 1675]|uniref:hypothetical protein n=1 Tax=Algoriphagus sp. CAU 1675 TaxID=3032597 RepID=UPI0023D983C0|nr:hypothetical protein [Algoriphagus sp. CAU 1675]MDF2157687.1 hypothetical protein [Algoriphagus sp. CAU 1675]
MLYSVYFYDFEAYMKGILKLFFLGLLLMGFACSNDESPVPDAGYDFQPLFIGDFWVYEVDQTIYFGTNDSEQSFFYFKDKIRTVYVNDDLDQVFIVERSISEDQLNWFKSKEYTLMIKNNALIRTVDNQPLVSLVFPPQKGKSWNGNAYRNEGLDEFTITESDFGGTNEFKVVQEESDDEITYRDIRYEVYQKGVGLIEKYDEVLTYCSRNDCLGQQLVDSGSRIHLKLINYGSE